MKNHAIDYLVELADESPIWFKYLVQETILSNGNISVEELDHIYQLLKSSTASDSFISKVQSTAEDTCKITLEKVTHKQGVNALKENESIIFSNHVTILFGLNGSGKSGYFKILNEIAGGNEIKQILPNIYKDTALVPHNIDVDIHYLEDTQQTKCINWKNEARAIKPLNVIKVFDSSYLNGLLIKRELDSTIVQPFGLHLFAYIIEKIEWLKNTLKNEANYIVSKKPLINIDKLSINIKSLINGDQFSTPEVKSYIELRYEFPEDQNLNLRQIEESINNIQKFNYQDKISIEKNKKVALTNLLNEIRKCDNLNSSIENTKKLILDYKAYENKSAQFRQQIASLELLPKTDSDDWKAFIKSGETYSKTVESSSKRCIYCNQILNEDAINLIKAYTAYLNNDSEIKLNEIRQYIEKIKIDITNLNMNIAISIETETLLGNVGTQKIRDIEQQFQKVKTELINNANLKETPECAPIITKEIIELVNNITYKIDFEIGELNKSDSDKAEEIKELLSKREPLNEHKAISEQKGNFIEWLKLDDNKNSLLLASDSLNTRIVSNLAKKAANELLTENLKNKFQEELSRFGFSNLEVELFDGGVTKGKATTKLSIKNRDDIRLILSEGEQKAIGLSLFIAEMRMHSYNNPMVFDDPVNSLDHKLAAKFAERLLELDSQIIVFTHHKLFLDNFGISKNGHVCKNLNGGCNNTKGKHIFLYQIQDEGKHLKGVLRTKQEDRAITYFNEAQNYLDEVPFAKSGEVAYKIRKTVECAIDEKVFNNMIPTKYSSKNSRIPWESLKKMNKNEELINTLKSIHDRVSGGDIHNGTESGENPITKDEYKTMISQLNAIIYSDQQENEEI